MPGLRAIAVELKGGVPQVSMNVERPFELPLAEIVRVVSRQAPLASAQLGRPRPHCRLRGVPRRSTDPGLRSRAAT